jgi:hypothetical protein
MPLLKTYPAVSLKHEPISRAETETGNLSNPHICWSTSHYIPLGYWIAPYNFKMPSARMHDIHCRSQAKWTPNRKTISTVAELLYIQLTLFRPVLELFSNSVYNSSILFS